MTLSTSEVAVCRSSASLVSLNRRTFSIAITAWSAKVLRSASWRGEIGPGSRKVKLIEPTGFPSRIMGAARRRRKPPAGEDTPS